MINYAHRGASAYAPENTMAAFCLGVEMGANGIETDVQRTRDGVLVLCHDATMLRTAGLDRRVCDLDWAELSMLDVGRFKGERYRGERIVRLEDFLYYFGGKPLHFAIEIKQSGIEIQTLSLLRRYLDPERFTVTSFMLESLTVLSRQENPPRLGYLSRACDAALLDSLQAMHIDEVCPDASTLTMQIACEIRRRGMGIRAWGVKTQELMEKMCALGVDGMTVNFPDKLSEYLLEDDCVRRGEQT